MGSEGCRKILVQVKLETLEQYISSVDRKVSEIWTVQ